MPNSATNSSKNQFSLSRGKLFAYGSPALPLAAFGFPLYVYLPTFYAQNVGLSLAVVAMIMWLSRIFDVVTDPLIGSLSDRFDLPGGRRKAWIVMGSPILIIGCYYLFIPPKDATWAYLLFWSMFAYIGWTMIVLPLSALGAEISEDYHERTRITASREAFLIIGTVASVLIGAVATGMTGDGYGESANAITLKGIFLLMAISLPITVLLMCWKVAEPKQRIKSVSWAQGWPLLKNNRPLKRLLFAYLINGFANGFPATLFLIFGTHVLKLTEVQVGIVLLVYFAIAMIALPFWLQLGRRMEKHRLWCAALAVVSCAFITVPLLGEGDFLWFLLVCVFTGIGLGVDVAAPASMQADVIEHDTANGGGGRAGLYFALWGMATKLALAMAVGIAFGILALAGFDAQSFDNTPRSLTVLTMIYCFVPSIIKMSVIAIMWDFPLGRKEQDEMRARVAAKAAAKG